MSSILISSDGSDITNNNTITFANTPNSTYFTEIDTGYTMFSGELSLTTTNDKNSSSKQVETIQILDENDNGLGKMDTKNIKFEKSMKTILPFNFGGVYAGNKAKKIKVDVGKDDGIDIYKFDISACNTNISHIVPNDKRWVKDKTRTFTFDNTIPLIDCPKPNINGMNKYLGDGSAYVIMKPIKLSYLDGLSFSYTSANENENTINPDFTYVIYGSDSPDYFNEIIYNGTVTGGSGTETITLDDQNASPSTNGYAKPFNYYKLLITTVSTDNITLSDFNPGFSSFSFQSDALNRDKKQHFEHFTNKTTTISEFIVPGVITLLFISVLSLRK
jgi:hypothetical protein